MTQVVMKPRIRFSPPLVALAIAVICVILFVATNFGVGKPHGETMFSASTTGSSADAAGATITPTRAPSK